MHLRTYLASALTTALIAAAPMVLADDYKTPKNSWGQPDIGGVWSNGTTTRFERPKEFGDQLILTEAQTAKLEGRAEAYREAGNVRTNPDEGAPEDGNTRLGYNRFWTDPGTAVMRVDGKPRSSMITFPADGRIPPRKKSAPPIPPRTVNIGVPEGPESRALSERCIFFATTAGPVLRPVLYNNNYLITQGKDSVAIVVEMINDTRIVRIGEKHHATDLERWMGDAIGWYEDDTLVVETINYHPAQVFYGASDELKVTERFTRVAEDRLLYQFTVEDPVVWDEPWGGEYEMWASPGIYEYACHEGNIGLEGILAGARAEERRAKEAEKK